MGGHRSVLAQGSASGNKVGGLRAGLGGQS